ncbi:MAG: peptidylprolyl isomerase [Proteobacteria bacterium]|nr:peptidylprolyl isomerase [Pseudomonadota bacterium]
MLPAALAEVTDAEVERIFSVDFADALEPLVVGEWTGPVQSGYGLHLVRLDARDPGRTATLEDVRDAVLRAFLSDQSNQLNEAFYQALKSRYTVRVEGTS